MLKQTPPASSEDGWKAARDERVRTHHWLESYAAGKPADDKERLMTAARLLSDATLQEWHFREAAQHEAVHQGIEAMTHQDFAAARAAHRESESELLKGYRSRVVEEEVRIGAALKRATPEESPHRALCKAIWRSAKWLQFMVDHGTTPGDHPSYRPLDALRDTGLGELERAWEAAASHKDALVERDAHSEVVLATAFGLILAWRCIEELGMRPAWRKAYSGMSQTALLQAEKSL